MKTVVHFLRHGEVHNPSGILYGVLPGYQLSELGKQMADAVAETLHGQDITYLVSSPLERAQETAQSLAEVLQLPIDTDPNLIEGDNYFEGSQVGSALREPKHWWALRNPFRPSWGEPYRVIADRMTTALQSAREKAAGHAAVCVSHQLPIWLLRIRHQGGRLWHDPRSRQCALASLTSLHFTGNRLTEITYLEPAAHLGPGKGVGA